VICQVIQFFLALLASGRLIYSIASFSNSRYSRAQKRTVDAILYSCNLNGIQTNLQKT
jgi:hypothetical protein